MPRMDGTGPMGYGILTGKGFGLCGYGIRRRIGRFFGYTRPAALSETEEKKVLEAELKEINLEKQEIEKRLKEIK